MASAELLVDHRCHGIVGGKAPGLRAADLGFNTWWGRPGTLGISNFGWAKEFCLRMLTWISEYVMGLPNPSERHWFIFTLEIRWLHSSPPARMLKWAASAWRVVPTIDCSKRTGGEIVGLGCTLYVKIHPNNWVCRDHQDSCKGCNPGWLLSWWTHLCSIIRNWVWQKVNDVKNTNMMWYLYIVNMLLAIYIYIYHSALEYHTMVALISIINRLLCSWSRPVSHAWASQQCTAVAPGPDRWTHRDTFPARLHPLGSRHCGKIAQKLKTTN